MDPSSEEDAQREAALFQAVTLFSTLSTATAVWQAAQERRAGRDPSEQEDAAVVRLYLHAATGDLQGLLMQLRTSLVQAERAEEGRIAAFIRRFHDLMGLHRTSRSLHVIHQRLLSLYPEVAEEVVEGARLLARRASQLLDVDGEAFYRLLEPFLEEALHFTGGLHRALTAPR